MNIQEVIEKAYREGWQDGNAAGDGRTTNEDRDWMLSKARWEESYLIEDKEQPS